MKFGHGCKSVGKFAEQGRRYFDLTWECGEYDVKAISKDRLQKRMPNECPAVAVLLPVTTRLRSRRIARTITIDSASTPGPQPWARSPIDCLPPALVSIEWSNWLWCESKSISPVLSSAELTGLLNQHVESYFVNDGESEYKPLPTSYANTWLNNVGQRETFAPALAN